MRKSLTMVLCLLLAVFQLAAQTRTIKGKVTDDKGNALPNASVVVKGSSTGTTTDAEGNFSINVTAGARTLVVSALNFENEEVGIRGNGPLTILLKSSVDNLGEIVVVGYGTKKKADLTGAVATLKGAELENKPFSSVDRALQGKIAGLQSVSPTGLPGANQQLLIRGVSSITASNSPLWVIDGVPVNTGDVSRLAIVNGTNLLSTLNPNDIESISVLKDAASQSIYGSRAANGVIVVTTKKGKSGKTKLRFDTEIGQSDIAYTNDRYRPLNAKQYLDITEEGLKNLGATPAQVTSTLASLGFGNGIDFNWYDAIMRKGTQQQYNLSAEGGNDKTSFFISGGHFIQEGTSINSKITRTSVNMRVSNKVTDKLTVGVNVNGGVVNGRSPLNGGSFGNPILNSIFMLPTRSAYNADGSYNFNLSGLHNTIYLSETDKRVNSQLSIRGSANLEYKILENLRFKSNYGGDYNLFEENQYNNPLHGDGAPSNGRAFGYTTRLYNWVWTNTLDYQQKILANGDLTASAQAGYESQKSSQYNVSVQSQDFPPTTALTFASAGAKPITALATISQYAFVSQFASLSLNYKNRYVVSGSFRRDGSSRFGTNNRYGNFWSVGASWNIDRERFMENISYVSQLKLRGSYGVNGNASIGNYDALALYGYGSNYNQQPGSGPSNVGDPNLTWELNKPFDLGIDIGLFKNRLTLTVDYYLRKSENLLLDVPLSTTSGFTSATRNIGAMQNKGVEITLGATPVISRDFKWEVDFNFANNRNVITSLPGGNDIADGTRVLREGVSYGSFFQRVYAGVDPANGNPLWYTDATHKTTTSTYPGAAAREIIGQAQPKFFGSLSNAITYKGFSLSAQFYYNFGNMVYDSWGNYYAGAGFGATFNKVQRVMERWQKPGDITDMPRYVYNGNNNFNLIHSFYFNQGDFIRLRDLQVGYQLPKTVLDRLKISNLFFYVRGTNLFTWVKDKGLGFDPEQGTGSSSNLNIFIPKTVTAGLNLTF